MLKNADAWIDNLINGNVRHAMPIVTYPGLQITGKKVIDLVTNGEEQARCILQLSERFPSVAGVMVMDLSVESEAFGSQVTFSENEVPTISNRICNDNHSIQQIKIPEIGSARTGEYLKAASIASSGTKHKPVFGGMIGPYSLAGRLFDITEMMTFILLEPHSAHLLLSKCTEFLVEYAKAYKKSGANGLVIAEPAAGLLFPEACHEFSSHYIKSIVNAVQDNDFLVILHNCGNTVTLVKSMLTTGCRAFHFGNSIDILDILSQIPSDIIVSGNLDPVSVLKMGSVEKIYDKTQVLLERTKKYNNFLLSSGCDVPPGTPLKNIEAFYDALNNYNINM